MNRQTEAWSGTFGREYTDRNRLSVEQLDSLYEERYAHSRSALNRRFLAGVPKSARVLEVGCNVGNQVACLAAAGFTDLHGIELQEYAVALARERLPNVDIRMGSAYELPFADGTFDLVFTSGVLIHLPDEGLAGAIDELERVTSRWIWGLEYFAPERQAVRYRNQDGLLWKDDFARTITERHPHMRLVAAEVLPYRDGSGLADSMYLLEKGSP